MNKEKGIDIKKELSEDVLNTENLIKEKSAPKVKEVSIDGNVILGSAPKGKVTPLSDISFS